MMKRSLILLFIILLMTGCESKVNPEPLMAGEDASGADASYEMTDPDTVIDIKALCLSDLAYNSEAGADGYNQGYLLIEKTGENKANIYRAVFEAGEKSDGEYADGYFIEFYETEFPDCEFFEGESSVEVFNAVKNTINGVDYNTMCAWAVSADENGKFTDFKDFIDACKNNGGSDNSGFVCVISGDLSKAMGGYGFEEQIAPSAVKSYADNGIVSFIKRFYSERGSRIQHFGTADSE